MGYEKPQITEVGTVSDLTLGRHGGPRPPKPNHGVS
ncbi:lasso RiPP family leader peptide-containing protein [Actinotalea fermentans]|nr:lasso RiPP family leader peptide-containing protein [Actinotalea fermentans]